MTAVELSGRASEDRRTVASAGRFWSPGDGESEGTGFGDTGSDISGQLLQSGRGVRGEFVAHGCHIPGPHEFAADEAVHPRRGGVLDRKSTRLNSSHVSISYAVFCLKN